MTQEMQVGAQVATCTSPQSDRQTSQRSFLNAPIPRLLLKVAVKGAYQCDFDIFAGAHGPQRMNTCKEPASQCCVRRWRFGIEF